MYYTIIRTEEENEINEILGRSNRKLTELIETAEEIQETIKHAKTSLDDCTEKLGISDSGSKSEEIRFPSLKRSQTEEERDASTKEREKCMDELRENI